MKFEEWRLCHCGSEVTGPAHLHPTGCSENTTSPSWLDDKVIKCWFHSHFFPSRKNPPSQTHCAPHWGVFVVATLVWRWRVGRWAADRFERTTVTTEENMWNWVSRLWIWQRPRPSFPAPPTYKHRHKHRCHRSMFLLWRYWDADHSSKAPSRPNTNPCLRALESHWVTGMDRREIFGCFCCLDFALLFF